MNPTKTQAIQAFLATHTLADLAGLYTSQMEVQVIVAKDQGERIDGDFKGKQWQGYTDGLTTWKPIRVPYNAKSEPTFADTPISFDLSAHALGVGMTGWNWQQRRSIYVAFDFDAIVGHADQHRKKLSDEEIQDIGKRLETISWVQLRKSTGGKGRHVYVFLDPVETSNHTEHAAVARAVLAQLSALCGFDFSQKVDVAGGNMWVWHRKMVGTDGLTLLKHATETATAPANWRDYLKVISGAKPRSLPRPIEEQKEVHNDIDDVFTRLTGQRTWAKLDNEHLKLYEWLRGHYPDAAWWDADHHMLVTHTSLLKEAHTELKLRGAFETNAKGAERGSDINCFAFALARGGWAIRRYTLGVAEHAVWDQDGQGWTKCVLNRDPTLAGAARLHGGLEDPSGGWLFPDADSAQKAALLLGADLKIPNELLAQPLKLKEHKSGRLVAEMDRPMKPAEQGQPGTPGQPGKPGQPGQSGRAGKSGKPAEPLPVPEGWLLKGKKISRIFTIRGDAKEKVTEEPTRLDEQLRHLVTPDGSDYGWAVRSGTQWHLEPFHHAKEVLKSLGQEVSEVLGASILEPWVLVNRPFEAEFPGNRQWNRDAAQIKYQPSTADRDKLCYPSWLKVLTHCGAGLNQAVLEHPWCQINGVLSGADYLKCWIASLLQRPLSPLPYLFFFGEQNTGKSVFHEAISLLINRGVMRADTALVSKDNFNGELESAVLCVVEETDLRKNHQAYNRIKDWVTARELLIHRKHKQPYQVPNTNHFVQCANSHLFCPVFPGDTRITMIQVDPLQEEIPKEKLVRQLRDEAPDFLAEVLTLELPDPSDRLSIPVLETDAKRQIEIGNKTHLELFLAEKCVAANGVLIKFSELFEAFVLWLPPEEVAQWSKIKLSKEMPLCYPKGRLPQSGQFYFGNLKWVENTSAGTGKYVLKGDKLILEV